MRCAVRSVGSLPRTVYTIIWRETSMKCTHCNFTTAERISYCPNCGAPMVPEEQMYTAPGQNAAESGSRTFAALGSGLFLALCILVSASTLIGCFLGSYSVIGVLFTVFLWMVFAARRSGRIDTARLRCISGTVLAHMICLLYTSPSPRD